MKQLREIIKTNNNALRKKLQAMEESLCAFSDIAEVPVSFFSCDGDIVWEVNAENKICLASADYMRTDSNCTMNLKSAMRTSQSLGDVYIFVCAAGLINICFAFEIDGEVAGYFNAGPIAMGKSKERIIGNMCEKAQDNHIDIHKLLAISRKIRLRTPKEVTSVSRLYVNALGFSYDQENESNVHRQQSEEQNMIGMKIIDMKKSRIEINYPFAQEEKFLRNLKHQNVEVCKKVFSEYLGELMVFEGGNIQVIKLRLMTLFSRLFTHENDWELEYSVMNNLEIINDADTISEVINSSNRIIEFIVTSISEKAYMGNKSIIRNAINFIRENFRENINLKSVADESHVSSAYLSTLFKQEMGVSTIDYLNNLRLESAAADLVKTDETVTEIAMANGFREASYFAKLFKEKYDKTPSDYRKESKWP